MPEIAFDEEYKDGVLIKRVQRIISDAEIKRQDAPIRLHNAYTVLQNWADDARTASAAEQVISDGWATATVGQKDTATRQLHTRMAVTFDRLATFFERFSDILLKDGLDQ